MEEEARCEVDAGVARDEIEIRYADSQEEESFSDILLAKTHLLSSLTSRFDKGRIDSRCSGSSSVDELGDILKEEACKVQESTCT